MLSDPPPRCQASATWLRPPNLLVPECVHTNYWRRAQGYRMPRTRNSDKSSVSAPEESVRQGRLSRPLTRLAPNHVPPDAPNACLDVTMVCARVGFAPISSNRLLGGLAWSDVAGWTGTSGDPNKTDTVHLSPNGWPFIWVHLLPERTRCRRQHQHPPNLGFHTKTCLKRLTPRYSTEAPVVFGVVSPRESAHAAPPSPTPAKSGSRTKAYPNG
ncbi:hypothetical protein B0H14DRAFT_2570037 [Mycena olivaceomarginata]|nr:hypothetical protein B0H14DRAFT_2570037 [Mycena olivaceomarginata]